MAVFILKNWEREGWPHDVCWVCSVRTTRAILRPLCNSVWSYLVAVRRSFMSVVEACTHYIPRNSWYSGFYEANLIQTMWRLLYWLKRRSSLGFTKCNHHWLSIERQNGHRALLRRISLIRAKCDQNIFKPCRKRWRAETMTTLVRFAKRWCNFIPIPYYLLFQYFKHPFESCCPRASSSVYVIHLKSKQ